jgi:hypothetical protein
MEATVLLLAALVARERGGLTPNALTIVDDDRNSKRIDETFMVSWMMRIDKAKIETRRVLVGSATERIVMLWGRFCDDDDDDDGVSKI